MLQQTSLEAYHTEVKPTLNVKQQLVYSALMRIAPANNRQIAEELNWPINTITPRVLELRQKSKVKEAFKDLDTTGRRTIFWDVKIDEDSVMVQRDCA